MRTEKEIKNKIKEIESKAKNPKSWEDAICFQAMLETLKWTIESEE